MSILAAYMVPHPPMIVPAVGRGSEADVAATTAAYEAVADEIAALQPETIIITSPHSILYYDYFHVSPGRKAKGSFARFGAPSIRFEEEYDQELVDEVCRIAMDRSFRAGTLGERDKDLDHGTMVPLWFIRNKYSGGRIVRTGLSGMPLSEHYKFGQILRDAVEALGRRAVLIASGDLSHKLQDYGPYGYAPEGPVYDERIMDVCSRAAFGELFDFEENFCDKAAECGHRSFVIMAGAFDGLAVEARQLSHEDVTGVGYGICTFHPAGPDEGRHFLDQYLRREREKAAARRATADPYVRLAYLSTESYVRGRETVTVPGWVPEEMLTERAGVFVSIHKQGSLRGCIGTISPVRRCVAEEIIHNAVSAASQDPRFDPIGPDELDLLEINVDVLGKPEDIASTAELDVKRYGVIVSRGSRRGLLLPDLEGVDTVEQQVSIARQKAGIRPEEPVTLQRFEVIRHV